MLLDSDPIRLRHILEAAREALEYAKGRTRSDLDKDRTLQHCLVRCIEIVGEAANRITPEFRRAHQEIPWRDAITMRNRLMHAYYDISLNVLWQTVHNDLPAIIEKVEPLLADNPDATP